MEPKQLFESCGAIITNSHFVYTSGKHGENYINKDAVYPHTAIVKQLCEEIARQCPWQVDVVAGPTMGAVILSQWVAHALSEMTGREILGVYAEEDADKNRAFRRGYDALIRGKRVLVVEDILTTGGSALKVVEAVKKAGGKLAGVFGLCNRGGIGEDAVGGVPLMSLLNLNFQMWEASDCPLCAKGVPVNTTVGKGREFLAAKK
ncbi:MAG: phosphoribosyltransferase [Deltaproteobacteria bacterium CG11_big_fil_rev_8_21_14_0_20_47_16]|nr:MAG: phosphoribosyltransferase [Deltaproteobacteria bacterium CG11_big_fil_rev_8_21_14_0_20_47_16]